MRLPLNFTASIIAAAAKFWYALLRVQKINFQTIEDYVQKKEPLVIASWHDELFCTAEVSLNYSFVTLASLSKDGELISKIMEKNGITVVRGSSSRGGLKAMLELKNYLEVHKKIVVLVVDGPRGPSHVAKPGAIYLAKHLNCPIIPVRAISKNSWKLKSWDRFQIPKPFSKVQIIAGEPYYVQPEKLNPDLIQAECLSLSAKLEQLGNVST